MIDAVYIIFFWLLIFEVLLFMILSLPFPDTIRRKIIEFFTKTNMITLILRLHLGACFLAGLFFVDLYQTENVLTEEKNRLKLDGHGHTGSELRIGFLSYTILKAQRNKYISFMFIYVTIALNLYVGLLKHLYDEKISRGDLNPKLNEDEPNKDAPRPVTHHSPGKIDAKDKKDQ